jgi:hypothetical protein
MVVDALQQNEAPALQDDKQNAAMIATIENISESLVQTWFPANPQIISDIREKLQNGKYNNSTSLLLEDIKKDPSLYLYCFRRIVSETKKIDTASNNIGSLFYKLSFEELQKSLPLQDDSLSTFDFESIQDYQAIKLKEMLIASAMSQELSKSFEVDQDLVFTCSLFRQIGTCLIAWSYPHIFQKVTSSVPSTASQENVDKLFSNLLGFSPTTLGIVIARKIGVTPVMLQGMGAQLQSHEQESLTEEEIKVGKTIEKACILGEVFSKMQIGTSSLNLKKIDDSSQTTSDAQFNTVPLEQSDIDVMVEAFKGILTEIKGRIGQSGINRVNEYIHKNWTRYSKAAPTMAQIPYEVSHSKILGNDALKEDYLSRNVYLKHCSPKLREDLKILYESFDPKVFNRSLVEILLKRTIPENGFFSGCIYIVETETHSLVPRFYIGEKIKQVSSLKYYSTNGEIKEASPIYKAFRSNLPIVEKIEEAQSTDEQSEPTSEAALSQYSITGILGEQNRVGVLHLIVGSSLNKNKFANPIMYFKAIRISLCDFLHIA